MLLVNFKNYRKGIGREGMKLAEKCENISEETDTEITVSPPIYDTSRYQEIDIPVYSQHLDPVSTGSQTGKITAEGLKANNVEGTLINHSERRLKPDRIEQTVEKAEQNNITTVVCAQNPEEVERYSKFGPDYVAYEPSELIGGEISVSTAKPEVVEEAVNRSKVPVLTGAGIKNTEDVEKSLELGCEGVLVASGVVKKGNQEKSIKNLVRGFK